MVEACLAHEHIWSMDMFGVWSCLDDGMGGCVIAKSIEKGIKSMKIKEKSMKINENQRKSMEIYEKLSQIQNSPSA